VFHTGFDINVAGQHFNMIAVIGGITIVIAALLAFVQNDIKKVLAYSTVSQLGYMMMGLGVGAWVPAVFHIFTHAFFKCCLFLCAGSVAHTGSHHSFDMKKDMGGLRTKMPITFVTWILSTAALCGLPFFSGFFSKDEIIDGAKHNDYKVFFAIGLAGAFMTTAYMTRATYLTFFGKARGAAAGEHHGDGHAEEHEREHEEHGVDVHVAAAHDAHDDHNAPAHPKGFIFSTESPALLVVPLIILAFLAVVSGYLNAAPFHIEKFTKWVDQVGPFPDLVHPDFDYVLAASSVTLAVVAIGIASYFWFKREEIGALKGLTQRNKLAHAGYRFLEKKYYLDDLYEGVVVASVKGPIARASYWFNQHAIDGVVNGAGRGAAAAGRFAYDVLDQEVVDGAFNDLARETGAAGGELRKVQTGRVQRYALLLLAGVGLIGLAIYLINVL